MVRFLSLDVHWAGSISSLPFSPTGLFKGSEPLKRSAEPLMGWPSYFKMAFRLLMRWVVSSSVDMQ